MLNLFAIRNFFIIFVAMNKNVLSLMKNIITEKIFKYI